ncbi:hypothetical protein QQ045_023041 [Rhodiola kirilowii]
MRKREVAVRRGESNRSTAPSGRGGGRMMTTTNPSVRYSECQRNHAANEGGYVVDGCREFMASGAAGTTEAFICAVCDCHRNFHRKEVDTEVVCENSPPHSSTTEV